MNSEKPSLGMQQQIDNLGKICVMLVESALIDNNTKANKKSASKSNFMHLRSSSQTKFSQTEFLDHFSENTATSENPVIYKNSLFEPS